MVIKFTIGICCTDITKAEDMIKRTLNNRIEDFVYTVEKYGAKYTNSHITFIYFEPNKVTEDNLKGMYLDKLYYENSLTKREKINIFGAVKHTMNDYLVPIPIDFSTNK